MENTILDSNNQNFSDKKSEEDKTKRPKIEKIAGPEDIISNIIEKPQDLSEHKSDEKFVEKITINFILDEISDQKDIDLKIKSGFGSEYKTINEQIGLVKIKQQNKIEESNLDKSEIIEKIKIKEEIVKEALLQNATDFKTELNEFIEPVSVLKNQIPIIEQKIKDEKQEKIKEIKILEPKQLDLIKQNLQKLNEQTKIKDININIKDDSIHIKVDEEPFATEIENKKEISISPNATEVDFKDMFSEIMKRKERIKNIVEKSQEESETKTIEVIQTDKTPTISIIQENKNKIIKLPKPVKISLPEKKISQECISKANKYLNEIDKNLRTFFQKLPFNFSKKLKPYITKIEIPEDKTQTIAVAVPNKNNNFEIVITKINCPTYCEISFVNMNFDKLIIEVMFPEILLGENYELPELIIRTNIYSTWKNNEALAWFPITKSFKKYGFVPFSDLPNMVEDLEYNWNEKLTDSFCEYLNNYKNNNTIKIQKLIKKFITKESLRMNWITKNRFHNQKFTEIFIPIFYEYVGSKLGTLLFIFLAHSNIVQWPNLELLITNFFNPVSKIIKLFSGKGSFEERIEIENLKNKMNN